MHIRKPLQHLYTGLCCLAFITQPVYADDVIMLHGKPTKEQIIKALEAPPAMRNSAIRTRGLSLGAPAEPVGQVEAPVSRALDLEIHFDFDSERLTQEGRDVLDQVAAALGSEQLNYVKRITLEGHTDATGRESYNRDLSRRRAESVRAYLSEVHAVQGRGVATVGKGSSELANPSNPEDATNRRVRIIVDG